MNEPVVLACPTTARTGSVSLPFRAKAARLSSGSFPIAFSRLAARGSKGRRRLLLVACFREPNGASRRSLRRLISCIAHRRTAPGVAARRPAPLRPLTDLALLLVIAITGIVGWWRKTFALVIP